MGGAERASPYTSYMDLARKPEVAQLIKDEVAKINATLPEAPPRSSASCCSTRSSTPTTPR